MILNWNTRVVVRIRPPGLILWDKYYLDLRIEPPPFGDAREMELWEVAHIFGDGMYNGCDPPIELNMEIVQLIPPLQKPSPQPLVEEASKRALADAHANYGSPEY